MQLLKQNTATSVIMGAFVDATDGVTPETGVTLGAADAAEIWKEGAPSVTDISGRTFTAITGADGLYELELSAADTATLGKLTIYVADTSVCRPVKQDYMVVPANYYNSMVLGTDKLEVDVAEFDGTAAATFVNSNTDAFEADIKRVSTSSSAADKLEASGLGIVNSTCASGSTDTSIATNLTETTDDHYNGRTIVFTSGALSGQAATISDYDGATNKLTVSSLTEAPANTDSFVIV